MNVLKSEWIKSEEIKDCKCLFNKIQLIPVNSKSLIFNISVSAPAKTKIGYSQIAKTAAGVQKIGKRSG